MLIPEYVQMLSSVTDMQLVQRTVLKQARK